MNFCQKKNLHRSFSQINEMLNQVNRKKEEKKDRRLFQIPLFNLKVNNEKFELNYLQRGRGKTMS